MRSIKRALISVSDKSNLERFARFLEDRGVKIISTGGTREFLSQRNITSTDITKVTSRPESFGGRVKTLDFTILSGLLFDREKDINEAEALEIEPIDLLVCNFYPFTQVKKSQADLDKLIENIDIGGVTLVRAAAKNFRGVAVVTDVHNYDALTRELIENNMSLSLETRYKLMVKAFNTVANYDADIATTMTEMSCKSSLRLSYSEYKTLRYGENPHQNATVYRDNNAQAGSFLLDQNQLSGKDLSFNNVLDLVSALDVVLPLERQACSIIKHNIPCGLAEGDNKSNLLALAWAGDPVSSFGSVIAFNCLVDKKDLVFLEFDNSDKTKRKFIEVIAALEFTEEALSYLKIQTNLRILSISQKFIDIYSKGRELRFIPGGVLSQDVNNKTYEKLECVTKTSYLDLGKKNKLVSFGIEAIKQIRSNAIALVRECRDGSYQLLGQGSGQPNRLNSVKLASEIAQKNLIDQGEDPNLSDVLLVSEAFFPFVDNIEYCAASGIKTIIQPGGSIKDKDIISACDKHGIAMYFTGIRHFKH